MHCVDSACQLVFKDILVDKNDLDLMVSELSCSLTTPPGKRSLVEWIRNNRDTLGT